ncbi:MAG TPA: hypothetical protein VH816_13745 [Gaiellaceae bacterium]
MVATLGLGVAIAFAPGDAELAVDVWLLAVGTLALLLAIARTVGALPRERPTRLDAAPPGRVRETRPRELVKLEREVGLSTETAFDAYYRLRPTVRHVASARLRLRGIDLDAPSGPAESLLGPEAWELVRPERVRPRDHDAPGLTLDQIAAVVDAVEAL